MSKDEVSEVVNENVIHEIIATPKTLNSAQQTTECNPATAQQVAKLNPAPAQQKSAEAISKMEKELCGLLTVQKSGLITPEISKRVIKVEKNLEKEKLRLEKLKDGALRSQKFRSNHRAKLDEVREKIPAAAEVLKKKKEPGRSRLEDEQPDLLQVITAIATVGSGAHLRRRDETMRCCRTLDDLTRELRNFGYEISRSATYLRLLPRFQNSREGKRHVQTAKVKLVKAQTSDHKKHEDASFCTATIMALNSLASFLGM